MRIAVAGGTGWTGKHVVRALALRGDEPIVLARATGVDLTTGEGLSERLRGVHAVIDVTNIETQLRGRATRFFGAVTQNLLAAEAKAGVGHHLSLSIVGVDQVGLGYYRAKRHQEELVLAGRVPVTVLRATQFHEFAAQMVARKGPLIVAPRMLCQPVALSEVAEHLVGLAHGEPIGLAPPLAGPTPGLQMLDLIRRVAAAQGDRRPILPLRLPGTAGSLMTSGALQPDQPGPRGTITFDDWLATYAA